MRTSRRGGLLRTSFVVALLATLFVVGACSGSDDDNSSASTPSGSAGAPCGVHEIDGEQVRTFCGDGTMAVKGGDVDIKLTKAECETADDYVAVNAGTIVLGSGENAAKVKAATQYAGLAIGRFPEDTTSTPAPKDGTYTGAVLSANDEGKALLPDVKTVKVTLTGNRTAGTFTAKLVSGGTATGSFSC